ncbi:efflux RND transporter periplasmic adaptor subunit [Tahibacter sp. UC22_41]|uniref:efflux RND transporter periplasmic adaptor subunit n=1 Tax=Tahibacter sp. UC22_41 TaxID=3350178 RepID=UPI0036DB1913
MSPQPLRLLLPTALLLSLAACGKKTDAPQAPPPPEVGVVVAKAGAVPLTRDLVGRLAATRTAEVRARVPGIVERRLYVEGSDVKAGQPLFEIDPAPLKAALGARDAALGQARANAANADAKAKRYQDLAARGVIAKQDLDDAVAAQRTSAAAVRQAQADVEAARLNLGYAAVTAPIAGRAGRALVTEGALVGQGEVTPLTVVEQIDPIYVDFSQSAAEVADLRKAQAEGKLKLAAPDQVEVQLFQPDGSTYGQTGTLSFADLAVDPTTGSVSLRATFPNAEHGLLPGMFVKLRLVQGQLEQAFLVPQKAIQRDPKGAYVLVVGADTKVQIKHVELGELRGPDWVVKTGIADGDQIVVSGLQKVQPDKPAKAVPQEQLDKAQNAAPAAAPKA